VRPGYVTLQSLSSQSTGGGRPAGRTVPGGPRTLDRRHTDRRFCRTSARLHRATKSLQTLRLSTCTLRLCRVIAKFHYTDPTRTRHGPDPTRTKTAHCAHCRRRAKFHYTDMDPTRTRPDPHGPARTFFAAKLRWVRAGRRQSPRGSVSGPCSGI